MEPLEAFVESDFLAFTQEKWASNAFNRQRQTVKEKLRRLGHASLAPLGLPFTLGTSPEYPSQWNGRKVSEQWFFALLGSPEELKHAEWVADQERPLELLVADPLPEHKHLGLTLCINEQQLRVSLILWKHAAADQKNLTALLSDPAQKLAFLDCAASLLDFDWLDATGQFTTARRLAESVEPFEVCQSIARQEVLSADLPQKVSSLLASLLPLYRLIAWSSSHDLANIGEQLREAAKKRAEDNKREEQERLAQEKQKEEGREKEREAAKARAIESERVKEHQRQLEEQRREQEKEAARLAFEERRKQSIEQEKKEAEHRRSLQEAAAKKREEQQKEREKEPEKRPEPERPRQVAAPEPRRERREPPPKKPALAPAAPGTLKNGDRVQLLEGPFSGKVGVVQEIDHRREAKIALGMMSVKAPETTLAKF